jgi:hypothetical protein
MTAGMAALFKFRGQFSIHIHVEQEFHPATEAGTGNTLSSIAQAAYARAW